MAIKSYEQKLGTFSKAANDEPLFVLRPRDRLAVPLARLWVENAKLTGVPMDEIREAQANIAAMERFAKR